MRTRTGYSECRYRVKPKEEKGNWVKHCTSVELVAKRGS